MVPDEERMLEELRDLGQRGLGERSALWAVGEIARLRKALGAVAVDALQNNWEDVSEWARSVRIQFPDGSPEARL